jgi:hypothetical protein
LYFVLNADPRQAPDDMRKGLHGLVLLTMIAETMMIEIKQAADLIIGLRAGAIFRSPRGYLGRG